MQYQMVGWLKHGKNLASNEHIIFRDQKHWCTIFKGNFKDIMEKFSGPGKLRAQVMGPECLCDSQGLLIKLIPNTTKLT